MVEIVSGGDSGWRSGSGKWSLWREEMVVPATDVGPGSPTGVLCGTGARFPAEDQCAVYLLDWTFGTVFRARLTDRGATHAAALEPFLTGRGLPLTDGAIGADGAMYLTTGGRRTRSQLLRVQYVGDASVAPATWPAPNAAAERRREIERAHLEEVDAAGLEVLLATLSDADRALRFAARVGLEHQELERWAPRLAHLVDRTARTLGWLGVLRATSGTDSPWVDAALEDLGRLDARSLTEEQLLVWLRAHQWALIERPATAAAWRERLLARLDALYPNASAAANAELVILLVHLEAPRVIERTLDIVDAAPNEAPRGFADHIARNPQYGDAIAALIANPPPTEAMRFAFALRQLGSGWTWPTRERWFLWLRAARATSGGVSFNGFLDLMESQALANCDATTRLELQPLLAAADANTVAATLRPARGPGRAWTVAEAEAELSGRIANADLELGGQLYATYCASCHRIGGDGGSVGPDLSAAAQRFTLHDLLVAVLEPDTSVSDQYRRWHAAPRTRPRSGTGRSARVPREPARATEHRPRRTRSGRVGDARAVLADGVATHAWHERRRVACAHPPRRERRRIAPRSR
jgi:mono/diheme cytochrome c family protein